MIFIHTSDWHLGRAYARLGGDAAQWRFDAVRRIYDLARAECAQFILVAGDVFDTDTPPAATVRQAVDLLRESPVPIYLISGNHDPCAEGSVWHDSRFVEALHGAAHVHLLRDAGEVEIADGSAVLYASPVTAKHTREDGTAWMARGARGGARFRLALAHGGWRGYWRQSEGGSEAGTDAMNEIAADVTQRCGLDYLALGDYHGYTPPGHAAALARAYYSGTPEPAASRDVRGGYALLVEIDQPGSEPRVTPHAVGRLRIHDWGTLTLQQGDGCNGLTQRLAQIEDKASTLIRATLQGFVSEDEWQAIQTWMNGLQGVVLSHQIDQTNLLVQPTAEDFATLRLDGSESNLLQMLELPLLEGELDGVDNATTVAAWSQDEAARREARTLYYQLLREQ